MHIQRMTQAEFARHRGVLPSAVSNWKRAGLLVFVEGEDGDTRLYVDVKRSEARINARVDPSRGRPTSAQRSPVLPLGGETAPVEPSANLPKVGSDDLSMVRTDLIRAQALEKNLQNAKTVGELVAITDVEQRAQESARLVRERVHALHRELCERLAAENEPRVINALLAQETDAMFEDLANAIEGGALDSDPEDAMLTEAAAETELAATEDAEQTAA